MEAKRNKPRQFKTPLKKHNNLHSLMMEIIPEEYEKMLNEEIEMGLITEDEFEAIYGDGMLQVKYRIERHQSFKGLKRPPLKD